MNGWIGTLRGELVVAPSRPSRRSRAANHIDFYPDEGCSKAPKCLECPLPECVLVAPARYNHEREDAIYRRYQELSGQIARIAREFRLSRRSVHRAVVRAKERQRAAA